MSADTVVCFARFVFLFSLRVELVPSGANYTVSVLAAHNGPCVIMQSDVASSVAVKCWGPNGYGSLGVVR